MIERGALRVAQIVEHGAGGGDGRVTSGEPAAIERMQVEVLAQNAVGVIGAEDPVVEFGENPAFGFGLREERGVGGDEDFARTDAFERAGQVGEIEFRGAEFPGGDVDLGEAGARAIAGSTRGAGSCSRASGAGGRRWRCRA